MSADSPVHRDRLVHPFTADHSVAGDELVAMLGGKGAGLVLMQAAGIPVPPGFTMTTDACREFLATGWSDKFDQAILEGLADLEHETGKTLGAGHNPLLVSVRSGAKVSMPGMMDTVLNVGMNPAVERALASLTGNEGFAADTHRRALLGFAEIVLGAPQDVLVAAGEPSLAPVDVAAKLSAAGFEVPSDPNTQVILAVRAVFQSWQGDRATHYRTIEEIDHGLGTAATVQLMVFGNLGDDSGTGVAFSRNPTTGEPGLVGDFLVNAQGEDVVAGGALTEPLSTMAERWPALYRRLNEIAGMLEAHYVDMVDIEFTVENSELWLLQARRGKRSPLAAFRSAIDMTEDPDFPVDRAEAVKRCARYLDDPPTVADRSADGADAPTVIATGLGASPGTATGVICFDPDRAVALQDKGVDVILARRSTNPADVHGMAASKGIFTTLGGQVSHAALVAREWGLPAVVGASEASVNPTDDGGSLVGPSLSIAEGDVVTVDGDNGRLLLGAVGGRRQVPPEVETVKRWANELSGGAAEHTAAATETGPAPSGAQGIGGDLPDGPPLEQRVLHALRIKGMLNAQAAAAICATDEETVITELERTVERGHATYMEPRQMWLISPEGRTAHPEVLAAMTAGLDLAGLPYQPFLELNDEFKQLCTDWQLKDGQPNDHTDSAYDQAIFERLGELDGRAGPIIAAIGSVTAWMAQYGPRLAAARARLTGGDEKALTGVMCESYHDIWMELHEDLILTQGIDRAAEGST